MRSSARRLEVCALRFGNLSRRKKESGDASGVALAKLPGPCRGLIHALEDPALYEGGMAPRDMSKAALRRFLSKHADADRATRALESGELARAPWLQTKAEYDLDAKRLRTSHTHRRVALERVAALLAVDDRGGEDLVLLDELDAALADGAFATDLAESRDRDALKAAARARAEQQARDAKAAELDAGMSRALHGNRAYLEIVGGAVRARWLARHRRWAQRDLAAPCRRS